LILKRYFAAVFSLLPIAAFGRWRICDGKVKDRRKLKALAALLAFALLLNVLPWLWAIG